MTILSWSESGLGLKILASQTKACSSGHSMLGDGSLGMMSGSAVSDNPEGMIAVSTLQMVEWWKFCRADAVDD